MTSRYLLWLDLETTGLDPREDRILEIAARLTPFETPFPQAIVPATDGIPYAADRTAISVDAGWIINRPIAWAGKMGATIVRVMHEDNGLWAACQARAGQRSHGLDLREAEETLFRALPKGEIFLAGSSVHFDLAFLRRHMPDVAGKLSHRVFDVSAQWLLALSLGMPETKAKPAHRAAADVVASIEHGRASAEWLRGAK